MIGLLLVLGLPGTGAATECPRPPNYRGPSVALRPQMAPPRYRTDLKREQISRLSRQGKVSATQSHDTTLGLTHAELSVKIDSIPMKGYRAANGMYCFWMLKVDATLAIPTTTVYVAADYAKGSCEYETILAHENRHVAINREVLDRAAPRMQAALRQAVADLNPVIVPRQEDMQKTAQELQRRLEPMFREFYRDQDANNNIIDSPTSYKNTFARCRNW